MRELVRGIHCDWRSTPGEGTQLNLFLCADGVLDAAPSLLKFFLVPYSVIDRVRKEKISAKNNSSLSPYLLLGRHKLGETLLTASLRDFQMELLTFSGDSIPSEQPQIVRAPRA
jgi:hypothetical protein